MRHIKIVTNRLTDPSKFYLSLANIIQNVDAEFLAQILSGGTV